MFRHLLTVKTYCRNRRIASPFTSLLALALSLPACAGEVTSEKESGHRESQNNAALGDSSEQIEPATVAHPALRPSAAAALSPGALSEADDEGVKFAIEEGLGETIEGELEFTSGLTPVTSIRSSPERRAALRASKPESEQVELPTGPERKIDARLLDGDPNAQRLVLVRLRNPNPESVRAAVEHGIFDGTLRSNEEVEVARADALSQRRASVKEVQAPVAASVESLGGAVVHTYTNLFGLDVSLDLAGVLALAESDEVSYLSADAEVVEAAINGIGVRKGTQLNQFIDNGYDGEWGTDAHVAVVEARRLREEHPGFLDTTASGSSRIASKWNCSYPSPCSSVSNFTKPTNFHGTTVAGIILGDLLDDQDPAMTSTAAQKRRSGYAGEARLHYYRAQNTGSMRLALDHIASVSPLPRFVNLSIHAANDDNDCLGESAINQDANDLFELGILPIVAAGNSNHTSTSNCNVGSPGSAIGSFTVAAHGNDWINEDEQDVRAGALNTFSSRGGTSTEGKNRSIIDTSAYGCRSKFFDENKTYGISACGTSYAAPTVTAAAVDFSDWYKTYNGSLYINLPGVMFASLLLQGDRQLGTSSTMLAGYNNLWGAGRLKMRKGDPAGMDSPYLWKVGQVCVEDGEEVVIPINSGTTLPNDVDDLKAVIYWYDPQHAQGIQIDDIDLLLERTNGFVVRQSVTYDDNKERVHISGAGGHAYQLRIVGSFVTFDGPACGQDGMTVYYSFFYEDDDRDDGNGPSLSEIDPE